ncbi:hypothetical protein B1A99_29765 [Cohnella sp. CIP 111063]|uniref:hypothetical protein n=1 Tax=unclassified Cohnella TaxID=2636738 RepID=UPI000B8C6943|nr:MULTISPECIES: hypothetical protein [unclassified Cohnella]OXS53558.1 hypothetical protein B1A99_29765 [Cohnella sp. CIP 111063]PRX61587.1 hypothetical protein B0G52_125109 [Cohnella sp. SGD-V74]
MAGNRQEVAINADGLAHTEQTFKTIDNYLERLQRRTEKLGRIRANPVPRLTERVIPQTERIAKNLYRLNGQVATLSLGAVSENVLSENPKRSDFNPIAMISSNGLKDQFFQEKSQFFDNEHPDSSNSLDVDWGNIKNFSSMAKNVMDKYLYAEAIIDDLEILRNWRNVGGRETRFDLALNSGQFNGLSKFIKGITKFAKPLEVGTRTMEVFDAPPEDRTGKLYEEIGGLAGYLLFGSVGGILGALGVPLVGSAIGAYYFSGVGDKLGREAGRYVYSGGMIDDIAKKTEIQIDINKHFFNSLGDTFGDIPRVTIDDIAKKTEIQTDINKNFFNNVGDKFNDVLSDVGGKFNSIMSDIKKIPQDVTNFIEELPYQLYGNYYPGFPGSNFKLNSYPTGESKAQPLLNQKPDISGSTVSNAIYVTVPPGTVQLSFQGTEINYDELSINVGHKIALAVKQAMTNKSAVLA